MASTNEINLIRDAVELPSFFEPLKQRVRLWSIASLVVVIGIGCVCITAALFLNSRVTSLSQEKSRLEIRNKSEEQKELQVYLIKTRASMVSKLLANQKPISTRVRDILTTLGPLSVQTLTYDSVDKLILTMSSPSVTDAALQLATVLQLLDNNVIRDPMLESFSIGTESVKYTLSMNIVF